MDQTNIPDDALNYLRENDTPEIREHFEAKYGVSASQYLGQETSEASPEPEMGLGDTLLDVAKAVPAGALNAVEEVGDTVASLADAVGIPAGVGFDEDGVHLLSKEELDAQGGDMLFGTSDSFDASESAGLTPETGWGNAAEGLTRFLSVFLATRRVPVVKNMGNIKGGFAAGAVADFAAFDEHEARLVDTWREMSPDTYPEFLSWLEADETDGWAEGKFKNALEGAALGTVMEPVMKALGKGFKSVRNALKSGDKEAAEQTFQELAKWSSDVQDTLDSHKAGDLTQEEAAEQLSLFTDLPVQKDPKAIAGEAPEAASKFPKVEIPTDATDGFAEKARNLDGEMSSVGGYLGWDAKQVSTFRDRLESVRNGARKASEVFDGMPINLAKWSDDTQASEIVSLMADELRPFLSDELGKTVADETLFRIRDQLNLQPNAVLEGMQQLAGDSDKAAPMVLAADGMMRAVAGQIGPMVRKMDSGAASVEDVDKLVAVWAELASNFGIVRSSFGRNLRALQHAGKDTPSQKLGAATTEFMITGDRVAFYKKLEKLNKEPTQVAKAIRAVARHRTWDIVNEVFINNLLSGAKTHIVNLTSNAAQTVLMPTEAIIGNLVRGDLTGARAQLVPMLQAHSILWDSVKMMGVAFRNEDNILDAAHRIQDTARTQKAIPGKLGAAVRMPSRFLLAGDEFFKQINYRSKLVSDAWELGIKRDLKGAALKNFVADRVAKGFDETGWGTDEFALNYAREATFTNELEGSFTAGYQRFVQDNPFMRQITPFVRTPINLLVQAGQRTPALGMLSKQLRRDWYSGDPRLKARVIGKQAIGTAVLGSAFALAAEGRVTGAGPRDPEMRKNWEKQDGRKPYSVKVGGKWVSYQRMEPVATLLGIVGDLSEIHGELSDQEWKEISEGTLAAFMANLGDFGEDFIDVSGREPERMLGGIFLSGVKTAMNKSYLEGVQSFLEVMAADDADRLSRWAGRHLSSYVPYASLVRQTNPDPYMREVRGLVDALRANVWYTSEGLLKRYNFLGKPHVKAGSYLSRVFNPMASFDVVEDPFYRVINSLAPEARTNGFGGFRPPQKRKEGLDLTQYKSKSGIDAYEKWNQLIGASSLETDLRDIVANTGDSYSLPVKDSSKGFSYAGTLLDVLRKRITRTRDKEFKRLIRDLGEDFAGPDGTSLAEAYHNNRQNAFNVDRGASEDELLPLY